MKGSIRKRGSTWTAVYDEPREDGQRRQVWRGGFPTRREAEAFLASKVSAVNDGSYVQPTRMTFGAYLDEWLENVEPGLRPLTVTKYRGVVRTHLKPTLGGVQLQALTPARFKTLYRELRAAGMSESTIAVVHAVARRALADAVEDGLLLRNPAAIRKAVPRAPGRRSAGTIWTSNELRRFLDHVAEAEPRLYPLFRLAAMTGARRGELLGSTWEGLDLDGRTWTISQQLVPTRGGASFGPPKSERSKRTISLDADTVEVLKAHRDAQILERDFMGAAYVDRDLVFAREDGSPIHPQRLTERHGQLVKSAKVPAGRLHDLRHGHATALLLAGVPLHVVAARLGDDPKVLLATYAHLLPTSDAEAAEKVAALVA